jgi:hypothetical protein
VPASNARAILCRASASLVAPGGVIRP